MPFLIWMKAKTVFPHNLAYPVFGIVKVSYLPPISETPQKKNGSDMTRDPCFRLQHASRISKKQTAKYFVGKIFEKCIFLNMVIVVVIEICHLWHHCLFPLLLDKKVMQTSKNISTLEREFDLQQYGTNRKHLSWFVQKLC